MTIKPFLSKVTVTGADDTVPPEALFHLQKQYPYAEFGILMSQNNSHAGCSRFPSRHWLKQIVAIVVTDEPLQLSGHICGKWVKDAFLGKWPNLNNVADRLSIIFQRFQLNTHAEPHRYADLLFKQIEKMNNECQTVIFQLDDKDGTAAARASVESCETKNVAGLCDLSHGRGVTAETWSKPLQGLVTGYAGGLSPSNVREHLFKIQEVAGEGAWIDAETHLRSGEMFDLDKCAAFLGAAKPWVKV